MKDIKQQLSKLIQDNLPAQVADEMQSFISDAKLSVSRLKTANNKIEKLEESLKLKDKELSDYQLKLNTYDKDMEALKVMSDNLKVQEEDIKRRELRLDLEISNIRHIEAENRNNDMFAILERIAGSKTVTETVRRSMPEYTYNEQGIASVTSYREEEKTVKTS